MAVHLDLVGVPSAPVTRSWTERDVMLYAVGVGAGAGDPTAELQFTTENSAAGRLQVLPTFGCVIAAARSPRDLGEFDIARLVHAEQSAVFHAPLPHASTVTAVSTLSAVWDKGSAALMVQDNVAVDAETGAPLVTTTSTFFVRGEGGFGGERGSATPRWSMPGREPDAVARYATRSDQPLLYRLSGDRNPLHTDPAVARRAGFPRPILHGMCSYGYAGRALLHELAGSDPARLSGMSARFSRPALPGTTLRVEIWAADGCAFFRVVSEEQNDVVLDRGTATYR